MTRTAEDVGRGLAPARAARPIRPGERIHVIGAAGAGASAAVILGARAGGAMTACDAGGPSPYTVAFAPLGVVVEAGHAASHVTLDGRTSLVDRVAVTKALTSIRPDHPELVAARATATPLEPWQQVIADAAATRGSRLVGVAGTHGKSTSTGWLVDLLVRTGRDPSAFVGALLPAATAGGIPATARWGSGPDLVVEADEYAGNFDPYRPAVAVLLNAEWDHPDVFEDEEAVVAAFASWIRRADGRGREPVLVVNVGDPGASRVARRLADWDGRMVAVSLEGEGSAGESFATAAGRAAHVTARVIAETVTGTTLEIAGLGAAADAGSGRASAGRIAAASGPGTASRSRVDASGATPRPAEDVVTRIALAGRHNAVDALCVAACAAALGVAPATVAASLGQFSGVGRRMELKGEPRGVTVLDDYAHHPTAIAATLAAVRQRYPGRPVWAVYEPLTYHRTAAMLDQFADVLATADEVAIADLWAGRDPDTTIASAEGLAAAVRGRGLRGAAAPGAVEETAAYLAAHVRPGDVVLVMGGGRSYRIAELLVEALERPA